jgi:hypothetical protein
MIIKKTAKFFHSKYVFFAAKKKTGYTLGAGYTWAQDGVYKVEF